MGPGDKATCDYWSQAFPGSHHLCQQHKLKEEAREWEYIVSKHLSCIMVSITLTVWGWSWAG